MGSSAPRTQSHENTGMKSTLKRVPGAAGVMRLLRTGVEAVRQRVAVSRMWYVSRTPAKLNPDSDVVVSLTSYPARIHRVWLAIESMLHQTLPPRAVVLVLAESQFPERTLPRVIKRQIARGLTVLWTHLDTRSYKKLLPTRESIPRAKIVTVDDDVIYKPDLLEVLVSESQRNPNAIVGMTGWEIRRTPTGLAPYITWPPARPDSPRGDTFLTGVGGILYPSHALPNEILLDFQIPHRLCPDNDDIWFWAVAQLERTPRICLNRRSFTAYPHPTEWGQLCDLNRDRGANDAQLAAVVSWFGAERLGL